MLTPRRVLMRAIVVYFPWIKSIQFHLPFGLGDKLAPEFNDFKRVSNARC